MSRGYLLDSHALFWYLDDSTRLSEAARAVIDDPGNHVLVSAVSVYELMFKASRGGLSDSLLRLPEALEAAALPTLPIPSQVVLIAATLDWAHGDPWDRLLLAQATFSDLALISIDEAFDQVSDRRLW